MLEGKNPAARRKGNRNTPVLKEWLKGDVGRGSQNNLRIFFYKHWDNVAHIRAVKISEMRGIDVRPNKVLEGNAHLMQEMSVFQICRYGAKEKYPTEISLL